mgnify:CR=1 FL=1
MTLRHPAGQQTIFLHQKAEIAADETQRRRLTLFAMCVAAFMIQLDVTIVNVALPTIQRSLASTMGQLEWVISGYALSLAACIPLAGALGDRFGHKFFFIGGLIIFGIGSVGCAVAWTSAALIISRFVQGAGGAAMMALSLAILNRTYPAPIRSQAIGIWAAIGAIGFGAGPVVGGLLLGSFGWASVFWVNLPFTVIAVTMAWIVIPYVRSSETKRALDAAGIILASVGLACITFSLIESTTRPWQQMLAPAAIGLFSLVLFVTWQHYTTAPLIPKALRRAGSFSGACGIYFASYTAFAGMLYYVTIFFQNFKDWSAFDTGLSWLFMNIPFIVMAQFAGHLDKRFTPRSVIAIGCVVAAIGIGLLASLTGVTSFAVVVAGYIAAGAGCGALVPSITHVAMRDVPPNAAGAGSALLNCSRQLGTATGLAIIGALGSAATSKNWGAATAGQLTHAAFYAKTVATGRIAVVLQVIGAGFREAATSAFLCGYHVALAACVLCLLIALLIAATAFRANSGAEN